MKHFFLLLVLLTACKEKQHSASMHVAPKQDTLYTCSMHPEIKEHHPGKCPICFMALIQESTSKSVGENEIQLTIKQIVLGNIKLDTVRGGLDGSSIAVAGTLNYDQARITAVSSRIMGRIEKLYFKNQGDYVRKGDRLYDIYSEDLNNAKSEYVLALDRKGTLDHSVIDIDQLASSAKNKLVLWGLTESEIQQLGNTKKAGLTTAVYSKAAGYISSLDVREGDYVMEGGMILHLADLSTLWVEAQMYSSERYKIGRDATAEVSIPGMGRKSLSSKINFLNSEITQGTRINLMRIGIPNINNELKPGMAAYVKVKNPQHRMLTLPIDAVLRDGNGATVWVKTGENTFKSVMVDVGIENGDRIEITSGLEEGEVVVVSGAYLLNSEYIFKKGANPMAGMKM